MAKMGAHVFARDIMFAQMQVYTIVHVYTMSPCVNHESKSIPKVKGQRLSKGCLRSEVGKD